MLGLRVERSLSVFAGPTENRAGQMNKKVVKSTRMTALLNQRCLCVQHLEEIGKREGDQGMEAC